MNFMRGSEKDSKKPKMRAWKYESVASLWKMTEPVQENIDI